MSDEQNSPKVDPQPPEEPDTFDSLSLHTDVEPDYEAEETLEEGDRE